MVKEERTGTLAYLQSTLNAGLAVGAALGGVALHFGSREAYLSVFVLDAATFALCALVLLRLPDVRVDLPPHRTAAQQAEFRDLPYAVVTFLNMIMLLRMPLISLAIPLWIVERTSAPGWTVSALLVLNTCAVMLFQVRTAAAVRDLPSATRTVRRGGVAMLASCAVFALSAAAEAPARAAVAVLLAGAALQVWGEMMQSAGAWQISFDLAPAGRHGQYQGFFGAGVPVARMLGPVLLTTLVVGLGVLGLLILGALFLAAGLAMGPAVRWAGKARTAMAYAV